MGDNNQHQHMDHTLPLKSALFGVLVGAAAVVLSNKENRDEIKKNMQKLFDTGEQKLDDAIDQAQKAKTTIAKKVDKTTKALQA